MNEPYKIVYRGGEGEIIEKKSRFIAHVCPVQTEEEALEFIEKIKKQYWDARHNCYAYVIGERQQLQRFFDDGEPGGTAGKPILEVLLGEKVHNCVAVVTRYFGGTLLGTGGLVRAYTGAAQAGLAASEVVEKCPGVYVHVKTDYNYIGKVQYICGQQKIPIVHSQYGADVELDLLVPIANQEKVMKAITEATGARAILDTKDQVWYALCQGQVQILS